MKPATLLGLSLVLLILGGLLPDAAAACLLWGLGGLCSVPLCFRGRLLQRLAAAGLLVLLLSLLYSALPLAQAQLAKYRAHTLDSSASRPTLEVKDKDRQQVHADRHTGLDKDKAPMHDRREP